MSDLGHWNFEYLNNIAKDLTRQDGSGVASLYSITMANPPDYGHATIWP